ncbi:GNAT family N-acetyltransferase [Irregularibacter muris]|uniref:GNAT family N-acetyltransferase n=1 Tax=Irregularibacter muris TaxID=1796619 RepID=A0AAE3HIR3_9FIRM|nr:GNAT family N-acetyltransferase [Irregularibacter muris]MCR1899923.1 GNAT family N-acetyltransferase [Irregularibacter muris]
MVELKEYNILDDGEIDVILYKKSNGDALKDFSPEYKFHILLHESDIVIGHINFRLGDTEKILKYIGHIGYGIDEQYRGNKYAAKACKIIRKVAKEHGMEKVIITCNPDNYASRKTCETIGARFIEVVDIPETSDVYSLNETQKCRYEWEL